MNRKVMAIVGLVVLVIFLTGSIIGQMMIAKNKTQSMSPQPETEKLEAIDIVVYDEDKNEVKLFDFIGKPIIINFWATWCPYCVDEMDFFEESFKEHGDDIVFMMIDTVDGTRETFEKGKAFIEKAGYTFPVYYDLDQNAVYVYQVGSLPTTILIDKEGYVLAYQPGALTREMLDVGIELLMK